jgi:hypothetical protein
MQDIRKKVESAKQNLMDRIEQAFLDASRDAAKINELAELLKRNGLWERYEDRFFSVVKASGDRP